MTTPERAGEMAGTGPRTGGLPTPAADDGVPVALARLFCGQAINERHGPAGQAMGMGDTSAQRRRSCAGRLSLANRLTR